MTRNLGQLLDTLHSPRATGRTKWHSRVIFLSASSAQSSCNSGAEYSITAARARNLRSANSFRREPSKVITLLARSFSSAELGRGEGRNRVLVPRALVWCRAVRRNVQTPAVCIRERERYYIYVRVCIYTYLSLFAEPRLGAVSCIKFLQQASVSDACTQIRNIPSGMLPAT